MFQRPPLRATRSLRVLAPALWLVPLWGCSREAPDQRPNILWIVWDTVRADRLSLYGHDVETTPFLDEWAKSARVFDNCLSVAPTTVPSHASMFTGLMPSEHGADNTHRKLAGRFDTVAELLRSHGYQTYLYAANPLICADNAFTQGFDVAQHPWDDTFNEAARKIVAGKIAESRRFSRKDQDGEARRTRTHWGFKASGALAQQGVERWLADRDAKRPFFIFLNYMEAHTPHLPPEACRRRVMPADQVATSYRVHIPIFPYTFGLVDADDAELEVTRRRYDACLAELDELFRHLMTALEAKGALDNTVVILTADHGEQLGEHHMLFHQYSLYQPLLRVPLVVHYPQAFAPGRDRRPVMNFDLFPTLLGLAGIDAPPSGATSAVSLLSPRDERTRLAEYPSYPPGPFERVKKTYPQWDPAPFARPLRALYVGQLKYIWGADGRHELYDLSSDPDELNDLLARTPQQAADLAALLDRTVQALQDPGRRPEVTPLTEEQRRRLETLGYLGGGPADEGDP